MVTSTREMKEGRKMPMNKEEKALYLAMIDFKMKIIADMEFGESKSISLSGLIDEIAMDDEERIA
tara:strand:- start:147 stop:341 length:195 start_codon:yes stop_codon:yes gene_type:complete